MKEHVTIEVQKFRLETEELRSKIFDNKLYKVNKGKQKLEILKKYYAEYLLKQLANASWACCSVIYYLLIQPIILILFHKSSSIYKIELDNCLNLIQNG